MIEGEGKTTRPEPVAEFQRSDDRSILANDRKAGAALLAGFPTSCA